jgi:hypothetical protein
MREDTRGRVEEGIRRCGALGVLKGWCGVRTGRTLGPSDVAEERMVSCRAQRGHDLSMGRLLEKLGPALYSPECVEDAFSEVRCGNLRAPTLTADGDALCTKPP